MDGYLSGVCSQMSAWLSWRMARMVILFLVDRTCWLVKDASRWALANSMQVDNTELTNGVVDQLQ